MIEAKRCNYCTLQNEKKGKERKRKTKISKLNCIVHCEMYKWVPQKQI